MSRKKLPTIWPLEPHTKAKHDILRKYLGVWFSIMINSNFDTLLYIDGFAGPGVYDKGEDGSPLIVLKEALNQLEKWKKRKKIKCMFIEQNKERFQVLQDRINSLELPKEIEVLTINSDFGKMENDILGFLNQHRAPAFVFIDPFGYKLSMNFMSKVMRYPSTEILINFMYDSVNRWITLKEQEKVMSDLFGTKEWIEMKNASKRELHDFYQTQLEKKAAKFVRSFEMQDKRNKTIYYLFFGTNNMKGLTEMKRAMWKVDPEGSFTFSDRTNPDQLVLFESEPNYNQLKNILSQQYSGRKVGIEDLTNFVVSKTPFLDSHIRKPVLDPMVQSGEACVVSSPRKRPYGYPKGTIIEFKKQGR